MTLLKWEKNISSPRPSSAELGRLTRYERGCGMKSFLGEQKHLISGCKLTTSDPGSLECITSNTRGTLVHLHHGLKPLLHISSLFDEFPFSSYNSLHVSALSWHIVPRIMRHKLHLLPSPPYHTHTLNWENVPILSTSRSERNSHGILTSMLRSVTWTARETLLPAAWIYRIYSIFLFFWLCFVSASTKLAFSDIHVISSISSASKVSQVLRTVWQSQ